MKTYYHKGQLRLRGCPYIYVDPLISHLDLWGNGITFDFIIGWRRIVKGVPYANAIRTTVDSKYHSAIDYIKECPDIVGIMVKDCYENMKEILPKKK